MDFRDAVRGLESRIPSGMAPDLERITALAKVMGDPQLAYPSVHITGTNGKTSVARMVTALVSALGVGAGTYTSPHLQTVRERLSVAGRAISRDEFAEVYRDLAPLMDLVDEERADDDHLTYFEALTAMAYWWFADKPVDLGVFEVGMGGVWDATNLIRGEVAVLTPIDLDHRVLGATPVEVATEKAGIIKPGATVVSAQQRGDVLDVLRRRAAEVDATLQLIGEDFGIEERRLGVGGQAATLRVGERTLDVFLPVFGSYQVDNAALALAAVAAFLGDGFDQVDDDLLRQGFGAVRTPGRLEVVNRDPTVVLDGAHNPHGARATAAALSASFTFRNLVLVIACLGDKDVHGIVEPFRDVANHVVVTAAPSTRGASVERMAQVAAEIWEGTGVIVEQARDVETALELATGVAAEGDGVLVTGSLYTVGAARDRYVPVEDAELDLPSTDTSLPDDPFDLLDVDPDDLGDLEDDEG